MAKLRLASPMLIMLYGYPGAGKSFVARQLSSEIEIAHVQADRIRAELFEKPKYDSRENAIVSQLMDYMVEEFLRAGVSVIYDADVSRLAERRILRNLASKNHVKTLLIWSQIDIESAFARIASRDRRRADDKYAHSLDRTSFEAFTSKMQNPKDEDYVVVSGKHSFPSQLSSIVKRLREIGAVDPVEASRKIIKPGLINLVPNPAAGRVDMSRRNINIH